MLCSEKLPLWKLVNQLVWSAGKLTPHFLSFPNHLILPVKVAQYSFWQNTLNKAFPGSVEVIKDGYMLKCKNFTKNNVLYKTTTPHVYQNMNIVLQRNLGASWHLLGKKKKKHARPCIKVGCLRPAVTLCLLSFVPQKQTRVRFDSAIRSLVPQRDEEKGCEEKDAPHLRPAPPPPAMNPLSNRRLSRAALRRHHSGPWFLWFR